MVHNVQFIFDNKVNENSFDLKSLKMEAKRTEVLNLIREDLPTSGYNYMYIINNI